jgi:fluoride exporter
MLQWAMGISLAGLAGIWTRVGLLAWLTPLVGSMNWLPVGIINLLGCLGIGCVLGVFSVVKAPQQWETLKVAMTMGFLGGFTTFSSFAWDAFTLWQQWRSTQSQEAFIALLMTLFLQPLLGLIAVAIGFGVCKLLVLR